MVKSFLKLTSAVAAVSVMALAVPVNAANEGQIEGGNIYRIKNITKNVDFTDPANADACDLLQYKVRIHNPGPGGLTSVSVKATLPGGSATSHTSTVTVSAINANPASTSDTAVVNLSSSQSLSYQNGSTELLDANGGAMSTLSDGITQGGVNIGNVGVSINEKRFVQFKVKVNCPQLPAPQVKFACVGLEVTKKDRTKFDFIARASVENATVQSYKFTAKNSSGNTVDTETVNTSALNAIYHFDQSTPGTYTVSAVVNTDKGSTGVTDKCTKQITVESPPETPPVTPPEAPPVVKGKVAEELPVTGPASVVGIFAGASALAGIGHYAFRRFIG